MLGDRGVHPGECALADLAHDDLDAHVGVPRRSEDLRIIHYGPAAHSLHSYRVDAHRSPEGYFRSLTCCGGASCPPYAVAILKHGGGGGACAHPRAEATWPGAPPGAGVED